MPRQMSKVPPELLEKYESRLMDLVKNSATSEEVSMAYAEVVYLRLGCNKVQTAKKLAVDRRTVHRWFDESNVEEDFRKAVAVAASFGATYQGQPVRVVGADPDDDGKIVIQTQEKSFLSVATDEVIVQD